MDVDTKLELDLIRSIGKELIKAVDFKDQLGLNEWINKAAALLANRLAEMLSMDGKKMKMPDESNKDRKGHILWENINPMFNETCDNKYLSIQVFDRLGHIHFIPVTHMDYCNLTIHIELNEETANNLHKITDSIFYDEDLKELTASGGFPGAAIVQFAMVKRVNNGKVTITDARDIYKIWVKIVYDEWVDIIRGAQINSALLSPVLERYILNDKISEPEEKECADGNAHEDSLTKIINDIIEKRALKASDIRKLKPGQKINVILFDRNIGDYMHGTEKGKRMSTKEYLKEFHSATYTHTKNLTGKIEFIGVGEISTSWIWEINCVEWEDTYWCSIDCAKGLTESTVPDDTRVGWRGPAILKNDIDLMPEYFTHYNTCSDDYAPARKRNLRV